MDLDLWDYLGGVQISIIAKIHRTDLGICSHSREGKTPSYSHINTVEHRKSRNFHLHQNLSKTEKVTEMLTQQLLITILANLTSNFHQQHQVNFVILCDNKTFLNIANPILILIEECLLSSNW